jgi:hypothetical protein
MKKLIKTNDGELTLTSDSKVNHYILTIKNKNNKSSLIINIAEVQELIINLGAFYREEYPIGNYSNGIVTHFRTLGRLPRFSKSTEKANEIANVFIALPQKELNIFIIESIQNACGEFMEGLGFEIKTQNEPVYGSFFQKIVFIFKSEKTQKEINSLYEKGKDALVANYLNLPTAEATSKLSEAAASLINSISDIDEAAIRLGAIVIVKTKKNNKTILLTETVSPTLATMLDNSPNILTNPRAVYELLQVEKLKSNVFDENEDVVDNPQVGRSL